MSEIPKPSGLRETAQLRFEIVNVLTVDGEPPAPGHHLADVLVEEGEISVYIRVRGKRTRGELLADVIKAAKGE